MTRINVKTDCGNSPKKEFLKDFNIAFATGNTTFLIEHLSEDVTWTIHGENKTIGKADVAEKFEQMKAHVADELIIHSIITHGAEGVVSGELIMKGKVYAFCDVYRFKSAGSKALKEISSYVIQTSG